MSLEIWKDAVNYSYIQVPDGCLKNLSDWCKCLLKVQLHLKTAIFLVVPQNADNNPFRNKVLDLVLFYVLRHFRLNLVWEKTEHLHLREIETVWKMRSRRNTTLLWACWLRLSAGTNIWKCTVETYQTSVTKTPWGDIWKVHSGESTLRRHFKTHRGEKGKWERDPLPLWYSLACWLRRSAGRDIRKCTVEKHQTNATIKNTLRRNFIMHSGESSLRRHLKSQIEAIPLCYSPADWGWGSQRWCWMGLINICNINTETPPQTAIKI